MSTSTASPSTARGTATCGPTGRSLEFADYSFEEHFGKQIASYPPRAVLWDYIKGRVEKAGVRDLIRFNTSVRRVTWDAETELFTVIAHDLVADTESSETFDRVIVASGHFSVPNAPEYPGFDTFNGRILHAHDFRDAREFTGKDLLIIGTSYSAEDIGSQCWKYGAKSITVAHRTAPMGFTWPESWTEVPLLQNGWRPPTSGRAWSGPTTRGCSISACRTSGTRSTCSMRRRGSCAT